MANPFGDPVAANVNVSPNQGITTLSDLVNLQRQKQALQIGQQQLQVGASEAQQAQQQMRERQTLQQVMATGQDERGDSIMTDQPDPYTGKAEPDPNKIIAFARRAMPLLGTQVADSLTKLQADRISLENSAQGLQQNYRDDLSGIIRSHINDPRASGASIQRELDNYARSQGDAPQVVAAVHYASNMLDGFDNTRNLPPKPGSNVSARDGFLTALAQRVQPPQRTSEQTTPRPAGFQSPGGYQFVETNPYAPGGAGATLNAPMAQGFTPSEGFRETTNAAGQIIRTDLTTGRVQVLEPGQVAPPGGGASPNASPRPAATAPRTAAPQGGAQPSNPNPTTAQATASTDIARAGAASYAGNVQAAARVPVIRNALQNIINLSDQVATGPETDRVNKIKAMVGNAIPGAQKWKDSSSAYQEMTKYMEQVALQAWGAAGGTGTNEQYEAAKAANPNNQYNSDAVKNLAQWVLAGQDAQQAKTNAMISWAKQPGNSAANTLDFEQKWANVMDPRAFQIAHMTPQEIVKAFPSKAERADIRQHYQQAQQFVANPQ